MGTDYEVRPSLIQGAGRGLFALREYHRNEFINQYKGKLLSFDEGMRFPDRTYMMERPADEEWGLVAGFIDGCYKFNDMRFINHSRDNPNCIARLLRNGTVGIYARRRIRAGDELLFDYGYDPSGVKLQASLL